MLLQLSHFSAVDQFLLEWLPLAVGFVLSIWFFSELKNAPPVSKIEELDEFPKPLPAKKMAKTSDKRDSIASLIATEYQKRY